MTAAGLSLLVQEGGAVTRALDWLAGLPGWLVYLVLGGGAALENIVPPVPADTFVVVGGLLASRERLAWWAAWGVTWSANVASALVVWWLGRRYGRSFFERGPGRWALNEHQLERIQRFYERFGVAALFFTRFLPGLRAVAPPFAGISHKGFWSVALPVGLASGLWYGALVWVGMITGRNIARVEAWLSDANTGLLVAAGVIGVAIGVWWWRTRHGGRGDDER